MFSCPDGLGEGPGRSAAASRGREPGSGRRQAWGSPDRHRPARRHVGACSPAVTSGDDQVAEATTQGPVLVVGKPGILEPPTRSSASARPIRAATACFAGVGALALHVQLGVRAGARRRPGRGRVRSGPPRLPVRRDQDVPDVLARIAGRRAS